MPVNILMPALSPTMEEGTLAKWLVKEGEAVASGTVLAEIETDKATMEFESVDDGVLGRIVVPEGTEGVKVNALIAILLEEGDSAADLESDPRSGQKAPKPQEGVNGVPSRAATEEVTERAEHAARSRPNGKRLFASPLAKRLAADAGLDLALIEGSGPNGRVVKTDVVNFKAKPAEARPSDGTPQIEDEPTALAPSSDSAEAIKKLFADREFEEVTLDGMRKTIAVRLKEAKQSIPHFYLRRQIRLDRLLAFRQQINEDLARRKIKLSINDFIIKASAVALQQVPDCNAVWAGDRILRLKSSDIAVAVAVEGGLFTPVLRDCDKKTLSAISVEMKELASRAKARKLAPREYLGGSFAISNLGMAGIENFDAVINPPHASILAVGAGVKKPIVNESGEVEIATMMSVTLSADHRVIDGVLGALFLESLKASLEHPMIMLA